MGLKNDPAPLAGLSKQAILAVGHLQAAQEVIKATYPAALAVTLDRAPHAGRSVWVIVTDTSTVLATYSHRVKAVITEQEV